MDTIQAIERRHSTRAFADAPLERGVIERIIDAARHAPSAFNQQPWEFVVVTDAGTRQAIADLTDYGKFIAQAGACVAVFCRESMYYIEDGSAATQTLLIAAAAMEVHSCWVAGDKKPYADQIGQMLGVPEGLKLVALVALGQGEKDRNPTPKRPLNEVLHWERY
jgi:nitroreductase